MSDSPPQDCRSRGDCGTQPVSVDAAYICRLKIAAVAATAAYDFLARTLLTNPPQDCRSRGDCGVARVSAIRHVQLRLKIAAVAATAARLKPRQWITSIPPHDCRSRGDCGRPDRNEHCRSITASRLPQSRRLRLAVEWHCTVQLNRLTIAAVAATAAMRCRHDHPHCTPASRLPQSRRLRL